MALITVSDTDVRYIYTVGGSSQDTFVIPFSFYETTDIKVYNGSSLVDPNDYTVNGTAVDNGYQGGNFTLDTPVTNTTITVVLDIAIARTTNFPVSADFNIAELNTELSRHISIIQQLRDLFKRALKLPVTSTLVDGDGDVLDLQFSEDPEDGRAPVYDSATKSFINGPDASDIADAAPNAALALQYRDEAEDARDDAISAQAAAEAAAAGMKWRPTVRVATTANITLSGAQTIDGVSVVAGDRVLVKDQSTASQNGVYVVASGAWSRATDADTWDELVSQVVAVEEGSIWADYTFICTSNSGGTLGSSNIAWATFKIVLPDGAVSTAAKIADAIITYAKLAATAIASASDIASAVASKLVDAATLKSYIGTYISTGWTSYTPTFAGCGTVTNIDAKWRRVGKNMEIMARFTTGTVTGSTASMSLPTSPATTTIDTTVAANAQLCGKVVSNGNVICTGGRTAINFSTTSAGAGLTDAAGSAIFSSSTIYGIMCTVPINEWSHAS